MDKKIAFENLTALTSLLDARGMRAWLDGGSLLGCYRGGDLIDHDDDTDLGLDIGDWQREPALDFLHAAKAAGFTVLRYFGEVAIGLEICLQRERVQTDLFFYYPEGERVWCGAWTGWYSLPPGAPRVCQLIKYHYDRFELRTLRVQGVDFHVPADTERFLTTVYGPTWKTPDRSWNGMGSPPNGVLTNFVIDRDPTIFLEDEFLEQAFPHGPGAEPRSVHEAGSNVVGVGLTVETALHRARARRKAKRAGS